MPSPDYLPIALDLPVVYQDDQEAFAQLDSYLGLVDSLLRTSLTSLEQAESWLSPESLDHWPPGLLPDAGAEAVLEAQWETQSELAGWTGFAFPASWPSGAAGLERRREYLRRAARLWRQRGTPAGLLDWFALAFADAVSARPVMVEHFRVADPLAVETDEHDPWLRATLFVHDDGRFADHGRRRDVIAFVDRYAPAHVHLRVCWVRPGFDLGAAPGPASGPGQVRAWQAAVREVLCSLVSTVDHRLGIRIWTCIDDGEAQDRLDVGLLPDEPQP